MHAEHDKPDDLGAELRNLGHNLKQTLRTAWESEERKKIQREIRSGLEELEGLLQEASKEIHASEISHEVQEEVAEFRDRLQSGEIESRIREDLLSALQMINEELQKLSDRWSAEARSASHHEGHGEEKHNG